MALDVQDVLPALSNLTSTSSVTELATLAQVAAAVPAVMALAADTSLTVSEFWARLLATAPAEDDVAGIVLSLQVRVCSSSNRCLSCRATIAVLGAPP
jgi:hypothetical protein